MNMAYIGSLDFLSCIPGHFKRRFTGVLFVKLPLNSRVVSGCVEDPKISEAQYLKWGVHIDLK